MDSSAPIIASIVHEHAQEAIALCTCRQVLVKAAGLRLHGLERHDERLAAHLDGLAVAGEPGWRVCEEVVGSPGLGEAFVAAVCAIERGDLQALAELLAAAETNEALFEGASAAFGWLSATHLEGKMSDFLASPNPFLRRLGISACVMHRVDPGRALDAAIAHPDPLLRAFAFHAAGQCGRRDLSGACLAGLGQEDPACRFHAARSAVLLGDRGRALQELQRFASAAGAQQRSVSRLMLEALPQAHAHSFLQRINQDLKQRRAVIEGAGYAGDPRYVEWLIDQMGTTALARVAGEAFSTITGLDLGASYLQYDRERPTGFEAGPTDNPADDDVAVDEDDGLPWPDPAKLQAWWKVNQGRFQPGVRYFMGAPPGMAHCRQVLRDGYQRQRIAAAEYLCLLAPGTPLFPTSAPAWRQQRWLRQMG